MSTFCNFEIVFQLFLSIILGGLVGLEREFIKKEAGLRTFALVCLGATSFTSIASWITLFKHITIILP